MKLKLIEFTYDKKYVTNILVNKKKINSIYISF